MAQASNHDPRPPCPECTQSRVLEDSSADHYHWHCREPFCPGIRLIFRSEQISGDAIARDMADKRSRVGIFATSDARRKDQTAFRRVASTLRTDHALYRSLSLPEREAMDTAAAALRRLARATETTKDIMARRESREQKQRQHQKRAENTQAFDTIIAQAFDQDTVLLRCDAMADFYDAPGLLGGEIRNLVASFRDAPNDRRWAYLMQSTGERLTEEIYAGEWTLDFEGFWRQWRAGRRVRDAISDAQHKGMNGGDPDA